MALKCTFQWHLVPLLVFYPHFMCYVFSSMRKVSINFCVKKHHKNYYFVHCLSTERWVDL